MKAHPPLERELAASGFLVEEDVERALRIQRKRVTPFFEKIEEDKDRE